MRGAAVRREDRAERVGDEARGVHRLHTRSSVEETKGSLSIFHHLFAPLEEEGHTRATRVRGVDRLFRDALRFRCL